MHFCCVCVVLFWINLLSNSNLSLTFLPPFSF
jgi:hypothetical protein